MEDHAVVLEGQPAGQLVVGEGRGLRLASQLHQLLGQEIRVFDIPGIKSEVDLQGMVGDPLKATERELLGLVRGESQESHPRPPPG